MFCEYIKKCIFVSKKQQNRGNYDNFKQNKSNRNH